MKYFEAEVINTNGTNLREYFNENEYLKQKAGSTRLSK